MRLVGLGNVGGKPGWSDRRRASRGPGARSEVGAGPGHARDPAAGPGSSPKCRMGLHLGRTYPPKRNDKDLNVTNNTGLSV